MRPCKRLYLIQVFLKVSSTTYGSGMSVFFFFVGRGRVGVNGKGWLRVWPGYKDVQGLVDFVVGLVEFILHYLHDGQVKVFGEIFL